MLGKGSMATISPLLRQWEEEQQRQSSCGSHGLDVSITRAINAQIAASVMKATEDATQRIADLQSEAITLLAEIERIEDILESKNTAFTLLSEQHGALNGRVQQLESVALRNTTELAAERQATQFAQIALAKAELRLEMLPDIEAEIKDLRKELSASATRQAELHEAAAVAQAKLEAEITQRKNCESHLTEATRKREEAENRALLATQALSNERIVTVNTPSAKRRAE